MQERNIIKKTKQFSDIKWTPKPTFYINADYFTLYLKDYLEDLGLGVKNVYFSI